MIRKNNEREEVVAVCGKRTLYLTDESVKVIEPNEKDLSRLDLTSFFFFS